MGGAVASKMSNLGSGPVGTLLGTAGGAAGTGIQGPQQSNIQQGTTVGDVQGAQNAAGNSLASQQALLAALQSQNGFGQQNNVAMQQQGLAGQLAANNGAVKQADAMDKQQALNNSLAAANGVGTQNAAIQGLQGAAGMYNNIAQGRGPNPAQAALNQNTGQNIANQAALMASQRGAGANVGLLARQAAQQGAATQQQAVGQGATMQAQQQIAGLAGLTGAQQAIGGLGTTQAGMQQTGVNQQGALAGQAIGQQQAQQAAVANQANTVAGQEIAGTTANTQANLANQQQMQGSLAGINNANVSSQGNVNAANAGITNSLIPGQQKVQGGILSSIGPAIGMSKLADGGEVKMAVGGTAAPAVVAAPPPSMPSSPFGQFLANYGGGESSQYPIQQADPSMMQGKPPLPDDKKGDPTDALTKSSSVGDMGSSGDAPMMAGADASELAPLAMAAKGGLANSGGHVKAKNPAQKAVKPGDSYSNDKVSAKLSEGEIVLPRSVTMSSDPVGASAAFVQKVLAKRKAK